jgi:hypothetical protein
MKLLIKLLIKLLMKVVTWQITCPFTRGYSLPVHPGLFTEASESAVKQPVTE